MDELLKKDEIKRLFDNVAKFGFDELSKLFQNVANKEFISLTSMTNNTKEPITLNSNLIKFNPENLEVNDFDNTNTAMTNENNTNEIDIHQLIIKNPKEKSIIKEKIENILNSNSQASNKRKESNISVSQSQSHSTSGAKEYFESITQNLKNILNSKVINMVYLKNVIKLYATFVHSNNKLIEQENQLLLFLINEVLTTSSSSHSNFFELCNYWLYTEYFLSKDENDYYRYDTLLNEIIMLIDNNTSNSNLLTLIDDTWSITWVKFISQIPRYNVRFINHILNMHDLYFKVNYDKLKKQSYEKIQFQDQLPHLMVFRQIYIDIVNERKIIPNDKTAFKEKLLDKFIQMSRNDYNHLNARAINYLFTHIYNISKHIDHYEEDRIRALAVEGLRELLRITDDSIEDDHSKKTFIEQRFPLYLHLCGKENEVIDELPEIYASSCLLVKQIFDRYMKLMMNNINIFRAKQILTKCDDRCEEIVIALIDIFYSKAIKNEERIKDDGLFTKIALYYTKYYQLTKGMIALCNRIPLSDFYSKENFILTKIKANNEDFSLELFEAINKNESYAIYDTDINETDRELLRNLQNKTLIYIAGYYWYINNDSNFIDRSIIVMLMKYYFKLFVPLSYEEKINEINSFCRLLICIKYPLLAFIELFKGLLEYIKTNITTKDSIDSISVIAYMKIALFLNEKFKIAQEEFNDFFYERFISFIKNENQNSGFKENLLNQLDETLKVSLQGKDLIMFSDL